MDTPFRRSKANFADFGSRKDIRLCGIKEEQGSGRMFFCKEKRSKANFAYWGHAKTSGFVGLRRSKEAGGCFLQRKTEQSELCSDVAGETRLEHATVGFGDRCSTN